MKQTAIVLLTLCWFSYSAIAQDAKQERKEEKKENREEKKERHKQFWKKVGNNQRDFWKGEHEKHVARQEEKKAKKDPSKNAPEASPETGEKKRAGKAKPKSE